MFCIMLGHPVAMIFVQETIENVDICKEYMHDIKARETYILGLSND